MSEITWVESSRREVEIADAPSLSSPTLKVRNILPRFRKQERALWKKEHLVQTARIGCGLAIHPHFIEGQCEKSQVTPGAGSQALNAASSGMMGFLAIYAKDWHIRSLCLKDYSRTFLKTSPKELQS